MKYLHDLSKRIAPLTKEQYDAKHVNAVKDAYNLTNSITCRGCKVILKGFRHIAGNSFEDTIILSNWDVRTQRLTISSYNNINQIPKSVAQDQIYSYLMMDYEADCCIF